MSTMHNPAHPGEVLREYLPEGVPIGEVAKRLGVSRQALSALLNGRAGVSAAMAFRRNATVHSAFSSGSSWRRPRVRWAGIGSWSSAEANDSVR